mmetsp:Transcript_100641/g.289004  ORF Transcript_100641/g.289004 Transcript_100641/m.289004 type:complete len:211 (-) Transcript_100641:105-737(-)
MEHREKPSTTSTSTGSALISMPMPRRANCQGSKKRRMSGSTAEGKREKEDAVERTASSTSAGAASRGESTTKSITVMTSEKETTRGRTKSASSVVGNGKAMTRTSTVDSGKSMSNSSAVDWVKSKKICFCKELRSEEEAQGGKLPKESVAATKASRNSFMPRGARARATPSSPRGSNSSPKASSDFASEANTWGKSSEACKRHMSRRADR